MARRAEPDAVEDLVAETYLAVWRRWDDLPVGADRSRARLFGVARHVVHAWARQQHRGAALALAVAQDPTRPSSTGSCWRSPTGRD